MELAQAGGSGEAHLYIPTIPTTSSASTTSPSVSSSPANQFNTGSEEQRFARRILLQSLSSLRNIKISYNCDDNEDSSEVKKYLLWDTACNPPLSNAGLISGELTASHYVLWIRRPFSGKGKRKAFAHSLLPKQIKATLQATNEEGKLLSWSIVADVPLTPITSSAKPKRNGGVGSCLHQLAAKEAIGYYDGKGVKSAAVALALQYNISSKFTSFVAVDTVKTITEAQKAA